VWSLRIPEISNGAAVRTSKASNPDDQDSSSRFRVPRQRTDSTQDVMGHYDIWERTSGGRSPWAACCDQCLRILKTR
jgi:hypothetical protein